MLSSGALHQIQDQEQQGLCQPLRLKNPLIAQCLTLIAHNPAHNLSP